MTMNLTQKELTLLKDHQKHEKVCIQKYQNYASQTRDPELQQLLTSYAEQEKQHLATINQILSGQIPTMSSSVGQPIQESGMQSAMMSALSSSVVPDVIDLQGVTSNQSDNSLCNDMLMTEKFVSGAYDITIFEFKDATIREALNHIQKEEQQHGEGLFQYMQSKGMYNLQ